MRIDFIYVFLGSHAAEIGALENTTKESMEQSLLSCSFKLGLTHAVIMHACVGLAGVAFRPDVTSDPRIRQ